MRRPAAPPIDRRSAPEIAAKIQSLLVDYTGALSGGGWQGAEQVPAADTLGRVLQEDVVVREADGTDRRVPRGTLVDGPLERSLAETRGEDPVAVVALAATPDPGQALVRLFAHLAGIVIDRLNRTPDKAFLAFLDLIGVSPLPPQPARAPLTFRLAEGASADVRVPAGSRVAATAREGEAEPPVFETTRDLVLTRAQLVAACARDPHHDAWSDLSALVGAAAPNGVGLPVFSGDQPIERGLWLTHRMFAGRTRRTVSIEIATDPAGPAFPTLDWGWWDGETWQPVQPVSAPMAQAGVQFTFQGLPPVPVAAVPKTGIAESGFHGAWIGGRPPRTPGPGRPFRLPPTRITAVTAGVLVDPDSLLPDAAFAGSLAVDVSRDFLPFGERPSLGDVFMLAFDEAFAAAGPGGEQWITLNVVVSSSGPAADRPAAILAWEYWGGQHWGTLGQSTATEPRVAGGSDADFGFADDSRAFTANGQVRFRRPPDWAVSIVGSHTGHWLRVRIARGDYGRDAVYRPKSAGPPLVAEQFEPATWRPPSLRTVTCGYRCTALMPDWVLVERDLTLIDQTPAVQPQGPGFVLFPLPEDSTPALYLGFLHPEAATAFRNQAVTLYVGVDEITYDELTDAVQDRAAAPPAVAWEYAAPTGWRWLGAQDDTAGFTRSGLVTFIGPGDLAPTVLFGLAASWLRARWEGGTYAVPPRVNRLLTNTVWASQAIRVEREAIGSGTAEPRQICRTSKTPVLQGQAVEVGEPERPAAAELAGLIAEEGADCITVVADQTGRVSETWLRWHEVPDFSASAPGSRHYSLDRLNGIVTFGDGVRGRVPPRGAGNIRISYASGGGAVGNRPAGTVTQLKSAIPYVDSVSNLVPAAGGADGEEPSSVRQRGPAVLRHRHRAVAIVDFEDLALEASPAVARAKGVPARDAAGAGHVELVVVPRSSERRPVPSLELLRLIEDRVGALAPPTVDLVVRGPEWLAVSVTAEIAPQSFERAAAVRNAVLARLEGFLHPLTGGLDGQGWAFGRAPHRSDLHALIEGIPGVDYVNALTVATMPERPIISERLLVHSGDHQVILVAARRADS